MQVMESARVVMDWTNLAREERGGQGHASLSITQVVVEHRYVKCLNYHLLSLKLMWESRITKATEFALVN